MVNENAIATAIMTGKVFRNIFAGSLQKLAFLVDETYLFGDSNGIKANVIDSSHVAMGCFKFSRFECVSFKANKDFKAGINLKDFCKIAAMVPNTDVQVEVEIYRDSIKIGNYSLKTLEIPGYDAKEEGLLESFEETLKDRFCYGITVTAVVMQTLVKNGLVISDLCKLQAEQTKDGHDLIFSCTDKAGEYSTKVTGDRFMSRYDAEGIYSLNFLQAITKTPALASKGKAALNAEYVLKLGNNIPCQVNELMGGESKIVWLLAPRVEDTNEDEDIPDEITATDAGDLINTLN